jgi:hypothetical protein
VINLELGRSMSASNSVETQDAIRLCQVADVAEGNGLQINLPERPPLAVFKIEGSADILVYNWPNKEVKILPIWGNSIIQSDIYWL